MSATDQRGSCNGEARTVTVTPIICEDKDPQPAAQGDLLFSASTERSTESTDPRLNAQPEGSTTSTEQLPSSPVMDLETDFPSGEIPHNLISTPNLLKRVKLTDWRW